MRDVRCLVGIHHWVHHVNREMSGKGGGYDVCTRCHKEKPSYEVGNPALKGPLL